MQIISISMSGLRLKFLALALFTLVAGLDVAVCQRAGTFSLFDEGVDDAALMEVRSRAIAAVEARDVNRLRGLLSADAQSGFEPRGQGGAEELIARHGLNRKDSATWGELSLILKFGGGFDTLGKDNFVMPYVAASRNFHVEFGWCVAMGPVNAFSKPRLDAEVITTLHGDVLPIDLVSDARTSEEWRAVRIDAERVVYVQRQLCRSGHELRVHFGKTASGWKIVAIIAGD